MTALLNNWQCPSCHTPFALRLSRSLSVRRGFLAGFDVICPTCRTVCRKVVSLRAAAIAWPLTALLLFVQIWMLRLSSPILTHHHLAMFLPIVAGLVFGVTIGVGLRRGFVLVRADSLREKAQPVQGVILALTAAVILTWGFLTHRLLHALILVGACVALSAVVYLTYPRTQGGPGGQDGSSSC